MRSYVELSEEAMLELALQMSMETTAGTAITATTTTTTAALTSALMHGIQQSTRSSSSNRSFSGATTTTVRSSDDNDDEDEDEEMVRRVLQQSLELCPDSGSNVNSTSTNNKKPKVLNSVSRPSGQATTHAVQHTIAENHELISLKALNNGQHIEDVLILFLFDDSSFMHAISLMKHQQDIVQVTNHGDYAKSCKMAMLNKDSGNYVKVNLYFSKNAPLFLSEILRNHINSLKTFVMIVDRDKDILALNDLNQSFVKRSLRFMLGEISINDPNASIDIPVSFVGVVDDEVALNDSSSEIMFQKKCLNMVDSPKIRSLTTRKQIGSALINETLSIVNRLVATKEGMIPIETACYSLDDSSLVRARPIHLQDLKDQTKFVEETALFCLSPDDLYGNLDRYINNFTASYPEFGYIQVVNANNKKSAKFVIADWAQRDYIIINIYFLKNDSKVLSELTAKHMDHLKAYIILSNADEETKPSAKIGELFSRKCWETISSSNWLAQETASTFFMGVADNMFDKAWEEKKDYFKKNCAAIAGSHQADFCMTSLPEFPRAFKTSVTEIVHRLFRGVEVEQQHWASYRR